MYAAPQHLDESSMRKFCKVYIKCGEAEGANACAFGARDPMIAKLKGAISCLIAPSAKE